MMQTALNNDNIDRLIGQFQLAAIADKQRRRSAILRKKLIRKVDAAQIGKPHLFKTFKAVAPAAEQIEDACVGRPLRGAQRFQTPREFLDFLRRRFKSRVRFFPRFVAAGYAGLPVCQRGGHVMSRVR